MARLLMFEVDCVQVTLHVVQTEWPATLRELHSIGKIPQMRLPPEVVLDCSTTSITIEVDDRNAGGSDTTGGSTTSDTEEESGSILPAPGMFATLIAGLVAAGWVSSRRN